MIHRRLRLSRRNFTAVSNSQSAKRAAGEHFSAVVSPVAPEKGGCAIVVSKKVASSAVQRHLVKRRTRVALRDWCSPEYGIIVFARAGSAELTLEQISDELSQLLPRTGLSRTM
jgi:ribonuclease P protein component